MSEIILGLGANLSEPLKQLQNAVNMIKQHFFIAKVSSIYISTSLLKDNQADYYNTALLCNTDKTPQEVLKITQTIEKDMGRVKTKRWGERIIDIDIIDYNGMVINDNSLTIPHYQLHKRSFVLFPIKDIKNDYIHPVLNKNIQAMIDELEDDCNIKTLNSESIII